MIQKSKRLSSGIDKFDELIGGGFEEQSTNLIVGGSGSGKTIFALEFLLQGIKEGESVLYITFEEKKKEFYSNMSQLGWNLQKAEDEGKFTFLEYNPEKVKVMLEEGGGVIESIVIKNKVKRMVIDSITSFALLFEGELDKREAALSLFDIIRKWECTSLLTLQEDPTENGGGTNSLEFEADSLIFIYFLRYGRKRKRLFEILKMRGTKHSTYTYEFDIIENGIRIGDIFDNSKLNR